MLDDSVILIDSHVVHSQVVSKAGAGVKGDRAMSISRSLNGSGVDILSLAEILFMGGSPRLRAARRSAVERKPSSIRIPADLPHKRIGRSIPHA